MKPYHKIMTVFKRDPENRYKTLLIGEFGKPEFEYLATNRWIFTEKIDGTNVRVMWDGQQVLYRGRTERAQMPTFLLDKLHATFPPGVLREAFPDMAPERSVTLYGEGYGARIQKGGNNYIPNGVDFILFDVRMGDVWLRRESVEDIGGRLAITVVPEVGSGSLWEAVAIVKEGLISLVADRPAEGLVMRPEIELVDRLGHRVITKIKGRDFPR